MNITECDRCVKSNVHNMWAYLHLRIIHEKVWSWMCVSWPKGDASLPELLALHQWKISLKCLCLTYIYISKEIWELWINGLGLIWYKTTVTSILSITNALHPFCACSQVHPLTFGESRITVWKCMPNAKSASIHMHTCWLSMFYRDIP